MKKPFFILLSSCLILGACGNQDSEQKDEHKKTEHKKSNDSKKTKRTLKISDLMTLRKIISKITTKKRKIQKR